MSSKGERALLNGGTLPGAARHLIGCRRGGCVPRLMAVFLSSAFAVGVWLPSMSDAQSPDLVNQKTARLLFHPTYDFEDYSKQGYRRTGMQAEERLTSPQYDEFGTLLIDGLQLYDLNQTFPMPDAIQTPAREAGSSLRKSLFYNDYLNQLFVANDSYGGGYYKLTVGDRVRTRFSPLTLDQAMLNGLRLDSQVGQHQFSLVASRIDRPIFRYEGIFRHEQAVYGEVYPQEGLANSLLATYLLGGHYQTHVGALNVGLSYANEYRLDTQVGVGENSLKGTLPVNQPSGIGPAARPSVIQYLVVKVADEAPRDGGGARVYGVDILINGVERKDIVPTITRGDTRVDQINRTNRDLDGDRFYPGDRLIPPYVQFASQSLPVETPRQEGYLEASNTEYLLYWFEIPAEDNHQVTFEALVANDYVISLSEVYIADPTSGEARQRYAATYFYRCVSSGGRVTDGSNLRKVRFRYGRQTGVTVAGLHLDMRAMGFLMDTEVVRNYSFWQYPDIDGERHDVRSYAYYTVLQKQFRYLSLGGEYFNIPADYSTTLSVQDVGFTNDYTGPFISDIGSTFNTRYNNTIEFNLVDDNDDRDPFPDYHFLSYVRDEDGIYPGLDADFDGRPDTNRNSNGIPDYAEPFLLFYVDPDDYAYGDDLNNNGQIDVREDDNKPDYPYDRDLRGGHAFLELRPLRDAAVTAGYYRATQAAGGGHMRTKYAKLEFQREAPQWGSVSLVGLLKRVEDTIPNDVYRYVADRTFGALPELPPNYGPHLLNERDLLGVATAYVQDPLLFRNSLAGTVFLALRTARLGPVELRGNAKYAGNLQRRVGEQNPNRIETLTSVLAGECRFEVGRCVIRPQLKVQFERIHDEEAVVLPVSEAFFYPILVASYDLTPRTTLKAGAQGFPFLSSRHRDFHNPALGYDTRDYVAMATTTSEYNGYALSLNVGYEVHQRRSIDRSRRSEDIDYGLYFVRVVAGLRASEGRGG